MYPRYNRERLPSLLFYSAGAMTLFTLGLLYWLLPDLFRRTLIWLRTQTSRPPVHWFQRS